jgi:hypothetical protein
MNRYDHLPDPDTAVSTWTLEQCAAYVDMAVESRGEQSAEAGMGAMSLGYGQEGAYEAANAVSRPESDPAFVEANARLEADRPERSLVKVTPSDPSDLPF